jgi:preprotein translocase subunit Sss1
MNEPDAHTHPTPGGIALPAPQAPPENKADPQFLERHRRKCTVCRRPDREEIEQQYRDWSRVAGIARQYGLDDSALNRHVHAVGLVRDRQKNLRAALDRILERGAETPISGDVILRAVRAYACLTEDNKWVETPRRTIHRQESPGS